MEPQKAREAAWQSLTSTEFDVLVIGGGITGAGIARDAALRGLKTALIEKNDFGSGTSSKSSKLVHGGLRYLQHAEFRLVFEALRERTHLVTIAPHLVKPLPFVYPVYEGQSPGTFALNAGLWIYDAFSGFSAPKRHQMKSAKELLGIEPGLHASGLKGGAIYYDHQTNDARLTLENILDASFLGATILSYAKVESVHLRSKRLGALVQVIDTLHANRSTEVRAKVVINATGPWAEQAFALQGRTSIVTPKLRPTKGVHFAIDFARLPIQHAIVMKSPKDGRVVFALPWRVSENSLGNRTIMGTTDTDFQGNYDDVYATEEDVEYLLNCAHHYFPKASLHKGDILSTWAGLRPLLAPKQEGVAESSTSREHELLKQPGYLAIVGGKLTTYRSMAEEVVNEVMVQLKMPQTLYPCVTHRRPLPGGTRNTSIRALIPSKDDVPNWLELVNHWHLHYGSRAKALLALLSTLPQGWKELLDQELPYVMAEVDFSVLCEKAFQLEDVLLRRMPLLLQSKTQGLACAKAVAERMAQHLRWNQNEISMQVGRYEKLVETSRKFR